MIKRILKYLLITVIAVLVIGGLISYFYLKSTAPDYEGSHQVQILDSDVSVRYDAFGIPHIYAENAEDAYRALGYVHAQDRLFQMEMIRRLSGGMLSEVLGDQLVRTDKFFRTLGVRRMAKQSADKNFKNIDAPWKEHTMAYLEGVNYFVDNGPTPIEFTIMGMPKGHFEPTDVYSILGYMGLGFSRALRDDPVMEKIGLKYGDAYFEDWLLDMKEVDSVRFSNSNIQDLSAIVPHDVEEHLESVSIPLWYGSNSWVIGPKKSKSGQVLLANDTHIGISQPSVWYEAHISYPGFDFYGNHLAGIPFAVIGHSRDLGWGLTIFPFDGIDLYREKFNPENPNEVWENDRWVAMDIQKEVIKVKDGEDVFFDRKVTRHGPIINDVASALDSNEVQPISFWWNYLEGPTKTLEAVYAMNHAKNMQEAKSGVSMIDFIGLNVMYGDKEGNIAHWASGRIPKRPEHVNPKFILDGASGNDELLGFYEFEDNPMTENPEIGYVASANDDPGIVNGNYFPGYYCPKNRIDRILKYLNGQDKWNQEEMKAIQLDVVSDEHLLINRELVEVLNQQVGEDDFVKEVYSLLKDWDGGYSLGQIAPTIFTKLLYETMHGAMVDEVGEEDFENLQGSYIFKGSLPDLVASESSRWWDNIQTADKIEDREEIITAAFQKTISDLKDQHGTDVKNWKWENVHTIMHSHPLGAVEPLDQFFNVGPYPITGGNDVPNKMMFRPNEEGQYEVYSSPALRILLDFADVGASESINPTGQSGNVMSDHYKDQAVMFNTGVYRGQLMDKDEIEKDSRLLILKAK